MEYIESFFIFVFFFLFVFASITKITEKSKLPVYPFYLLFFVILSFFNFPIQHSFLEPNFDFVYDIFLPIILFESAINLNLHRFKIQFKTLTFLTTIALIFNAFLFALFLKLLLNIPLFAGLVFGTLISATDPIGVLAIFKNLKIPSRLKILVEGESMLNDATTIVFFELLVFLLWDVEKHLPVPLILTDLVIRKFFLSIILGIAVGYLLVLVTKIFKKDSLIINLFTFLFVMILYFLGEKIFSFSGPIFIIFAGLIYGNFSFPLIEEEKFAKNKYLFSFFVLFINLYFFAIAGLNTNLVLAGEKILTFIKIIFILIITRTITVYLSFFITNTHKFFGDEPDVYPSWQHIINFGGLKGIIPLILVNQIPSDFFYKNAFVEFTIYSFVFTNLFYPFIVYLLIKKYQKNFYSKIVLLKNKLTMLDEYFRKIIHLKNDLLYFPKDENSLIKEEIKKTQQKITNLTKEILKESEEQIYKSLHFWGAIIEKESFLRAYNEGKINYFTYIRFISEIDLQIDALLYPEKFAGRVVDEKGFIKIKKSWRMGLVNLLEKIGVNLLWEKKNLENEKKNEYCQRIISSMRVIEKMDFFEKNIKNKKLRKLFEKIKNDHIYWIDYNLKKFKIICQNLP